jgi:hypothetical protein
MRAASVTAPAPPWGNFAMNSLRRRPEAGRQHTGAATPSRGGGAVRREREGRGRLPKSWAGHAASRATAESAGREPGCLAKAGQPNRPARDVPGAAKMTGHAVGRVVVYGKGLPPFVSASWLQIGASAHGAGYLGGDCLSRPDRRHDLHDQGKQGE